MNLDELYEQLVVLLQQFLDEEQSPELLNEFAWRIIDYFTETPEEELPPVADYERQFWYAVWQIQHLCDQDHIADGTALKELMVALSYLEGKVDMPASLVAKRPRQ